MRIWDPGLRMRFEPRSNDGGDGEESLSSLNNETLWGGGQPGSLRHACEGL